jgi:hypothetical protein
MLAVLLVVVLLATAVVIPYLMQGYVIRENRRRYNAWCAEIRQAARAGIPPSPPPNRVVLR